MNEQKPGQVIVPDGSTGPTTPPSSQDSAQDATAAPAPQPQLPPTQAPDPDPVQSTATTPPVLTTETSFYSPGDTGKLTAPYQPPDSGVPSAPNLGSIDGSVEWTASEYIAHQKGANWYVLLAVVTAMAAALVYLITSGDKVAVAVVALAALIFGVYAGRQPREQHYAIHEVGVTIGGKTYPFHDFKSFSVVDEGAFSSISFMPLKRFMPIISIYYAPEDEDKIISTLSQYLPIENRRRDLIDQFMKKIRF